MAFGSKGTLGTVTGATNEATIALVTATTALSVGDLAVVIFAMDNAGSSDSDEGAVSGVADNAVGTTNVWQKAREWTNGQTGAGTGCVVSVWYCNLTTDLPTGRTITATLTSATARDATSATGWGFSMAASHFARVYVTNQAVGDGATSLGSLDAVTLNMPALRIRATAIEYGSTTAALTATASPAFTKFTDVQAGTTAAGSAARGEFIVSTGTGAASNPGTSFTAADMASVYVAFVEDELIAAGGVSFAGASGLLATLTVAPNVLQAAATFAGASTATVNALPLIRQVVANFAGASTLLAVLTNPPVMAVASFAGASSLTASTKSIYQAVANFAGASSLSATLDPLVVLHLRSREEKGEVNPTDPHLRSLGDEWAPIVQYVYAFFAGSSTQFANCDFPGATAWDAVANFAGAGVLSAMPVATLATSTQWVGSSTLSAINPVLLGQAVASFIGASALTAAAPALRVPATTQWAGSSSLVAVGSLLRQAAASFAGASALLAGPTISGAPIALEAFFAGSSALSIDVTAQTMATQARFAGASAATFNPQLFRPAIASFAGASTLAANAQRFWPAAASFIGASALSFTNPRLRVAAAAQFIGASDALITAWQRQLAVAGFVGAGNLLALPTISGAAITIEATFAGSSSLLATSALFLPAVTSFVGASTLFADAGRFYSVAASFVGDSTFAADISRVTYLVAQFAGASAFAGDAAAFLAAVAQFAGDSSMLARGAAAGTEEGEASFNGSSGLRAVATLVRNPATKVLYGSVSQLQTLRGEVVQQGTLRGEVRQTQMLRAG